MANTPSQTRKEETRPGGLEAGGTHRTHEGGGSSVGEQARNVGSSVADRAKDVASNLGQKAQDAASSVSQTASDLASAAGQRAHEAAGTVGGGMQSFAHTLRENLPREGFVGRASATLADTLESSGRYLQEEGFSGMVEDLTGVIRRNPIPAVLVGIGIGFLLARSMRS